VTFTHAPVPCAHAVHAPLHDAAPQHHPSLHTPLAHCTFAVHAPPAVVSVTHAPAALQ
jgi:hypothetical protein